MNILHPGDHITTNLEQYILLNAQFTLNPLFIFHNKDIGFMIILALKSLDSAKINSMIIGWFAKRSLIVCRHGKLAADLVHQFNFSNLLL